MSYLTNCEYIFERQADYNKLSELQSKFKSYKNNYCADGFNGNLAGHVSFNTDKKAHFNKSWSLDSDLDIPLYRAIPSALALYRLCCFDAVTVEATGQDGYKCVWSVPILHIKSNKLIIFGEHKGAFSFWTENYQDDIKNKSFIKDLSEFLTYLVSDDFAHPYDGLVAGSVG